MVVAANDKHANQSVVKNSPIGTFVERSKHITSVFFFNWASVLLFKYQLKSVFVCLLCYLFVNIIIFEYQRTIGPVNAHLIAWPSKAQHIQNLENI